MGVSVPSLHIESTDSMIPTIDQDMGNVVQPRI